MRYLPLLLLIPLSLLLLRCASLRPFAEVRKSLPEERFLQVGDQLVHIEQAGSGEPLLLIHGFGGSTYSWRQVMPGLAKSFRVVAIDLNGFGYTQRPRSFESYTREGQAELIQKVMDTLGMESAHFMSHSYGGGITLWLAFRHPERVRSMVLVDSSAPTYPNDRRSRAAALKPVTALFLHLAVLHPRNVRKALARSFYDDSKITDEMVREYFERLRVEGVTDAYHGLTAPIRTRSETVVLERIEVPTLIVWGAQDELISVHAGRRAAQRMPRAEFAVLDKTGHIPMEERPEELLELALPFLERQKR